MIRLAQKLVVPIVGSIHFSDEESKRNKSKQERRRIKRKKIHLVLRFLQKFFLFFQFIFQESDTVENKQKITVRVFDSNLSLCFTNS